MRSLWPLLLLAVPFACSPSSTPLNDGGTGGGGPSTVEMCVFSGGKTGSVPCRFTDATWESAANRTTLRIGTGATPGVTAQFVFGSTPRVASYSGGIDNTECSITYDDGSRVWVADTVMSLGACTLSLRTVRLEMDGTMTRTYELHGGFTASLQPDDGMGDPVTVMNSF